MFAGTGGSAAATAGPATSSAVDFPEDVTTDAAGDVYVAASGRSEILKITPAGVLSVVAGTSAGSGPPTAGLATSSHLNGPGGVAVDAAGDVYIADTNNHLVEEVTPDGTLSVIAGNGTAAAPTYSTAATSSPLNSPQSIASSPAGKLYIVNENHNTVDTLATLAPAVVTTPDNSGTTAIGSTLSVSQGSWQNDPIVYSYQWQDCDSAGVNCVNISSATASSYTIASSDVGHTVRAAVTASNSGGSTTSTSAASALVEGAATTTTTTPTTTTATPAPTTTTPTTTTPTPAPTPVAVPVSVGTVPSAGVAVSGQGRALLPVVCPATPAGCDVSGVLVIHLPVNLLEHAAIVADQTDSAAAGTVLASFSGRQITGGHSALIAVQLKAVVLRELQTLRIRRVKVTLTISNHLTGGPAVSTTDVV